MKNDKPKFTPGPWTIAETELTGAPRVIHTGSHRGRTKDGYPAITGTAIAEIRNVEYRYIECQANAHLIAAAPEMFEALELIFNDDSLRLSTKQIKAAVSALMKARGEK